MRTEIYCNESIIVLRDSKPVSAPDNEAQLAYSGKKELQQLVFDFCKTGKPGVLCIWSDDKYNQLVKAFLNLHETIEASGGVVFNEHGEILFIHRNGKWDLPKGKVNGKDKRKADKDEAGKKNKAPTDEKIDRSSRIARIAALREVREETGLKKISIISELPFTYHIYFSGERRIIKHTRWFKMEGSTSDSLKPQVSEGIIIARWIPTNSLACIFQHTYESLKPLIKSVLANT